MSQAATLPWPAELTRVLGFVGLIYLSGLAGLQADVEWLGTRYVDHLPPALRDGLDVCYGWAVTIHRQPFGCMIF